MILQTFCYQKQNCFVLTVGPNNLYQIWRKEIHSLTEVALSYICTYRETDILLSSVGVCLRLGQC